MSARRMTVELMFGCLIKLDMAVSKCSVLKEISVSYKETHSGPKIESFCRISTTPAACFSLFSLVIDADSDSKRRFTRSLFNFIGCCLDGLVVVGDYIEQEHLAVGIVVAVAAAAVAAAVVAFANCVVVLVDHSLSYLGSTRLRRCLQFVGTAAVGPTEVGCIHQTKDVVELEQRRFCSLGPFEVNLLTN
ncbi:hypothetical protein WICPIJ_006351 [Wickerhamomyces pijperi]|uniref:Uncharacterized protein n=1 Tax=Wickerhamomyces pijperi TaxID=599730 RepID=A0A9P8Q2A9_WICPI|nr:hypothetical protein WICPIJ_006351 [Wickerhamomyces pijperi]